MCDGEIKKEENDDDRKMEEDDPYAYLERDFSSEKYKIEVKNLPKYYGINVSDALKTKCEGVFVQ